MGDSILRPAIRVLLKRKILMINNTNTGRQQVAIIVVNLDILQEIAALQVKEVPEVEALLIIEGAHDQGHDQEVTEATGQEGDQEEATVGLHKGGATDIIDAIVAEAGVVAEEITTGEGAEVGQAPADSIETIINRELSN